MVQLVAHYNFSPEALEPFRRTLPHRDPYMIGELLEQLDLFALEGVRPPFLVAAGESHGPERTPLPHHRHCNSTPMLVSFAQDMFPGVSTHHLTSFPLCDRANTGFLLPDLSEDR